MGLRLGAVLGGGGEARASLGGGGRGRLVWEWGQRLMLGQVRGGVRSGRGGRGARVDKLRVGFCNIGTLQGKSIKLMKILRKRRINIASIQETKWVRYKARDVDGYKLWYSGSERRRNGVGLDWEKKNRFWEALDEVVRGVRNFEKIVVAGDFNGHIWALPEGYGDVHGGFGFKERNEEGATLLDFARAFGMHKLLGMDLGIKKDKKRRSGEGRPKIKWNGLTPVNALEIGEKLAGIGGGSVGGRG
ncbi:uncharacterized protein LOC124893362, partial [Capsicum annuum]|uniref:uncharacterized protein LOC124893362 n=1 Tax=Capsicum annuum TaxID=4072 RepID=UPI001FB0E0AD